MKLSHDTHLFRFGLPTPEHVLGLPIGPRAMLSYVDEDGKEVGGSHTPTSSDVDVGRDDFVVKVVVQEDVEFAAGGKVSQHMHSLKVGDTMDFTGPKGMIESDAAAAAGRDQAAQEPRRRLRGGRRRSGSG